MELIIKIQIDGVEKKDVKVKTEINKEDKNEDHELSDYARWFDDGCPGWTGNAEYNLAFLKMQQEHVSCWLRERGHLFLNEVYDILGIPRTKTGAIVGWIYDEEHENSVDFGLYSERNRDFINGFKNTVLLDFNVDGNILDMI